VSLLSFVWVAIAMFKAQAQKHRAVSYVTDENTQTPESIFSGVFLWEWQHAKTNITYMRCMLFNWMRSLLGQT